MGTTTRSTEPPNAEVLPVLPPTLEMLRRKQRRCGAPAVALLRGRCATNLPYLITLETAMGHNRT